jgi:NADPH:quinone reductase-like Zn-dependent oxidoreductase
MRAMPFRPLVLCASLAITSVSFDTARAADATCDAVPATMQAIQMVARGGPEVLKLATVAVPKVKAGEVLVQIVAASINPIDWKVRTGMYGGPGNLPMIPGRDASGVIVAVGKGVSNFRCGDAIVTFLDDTSGGYAEYVATPTNVVAPKPKNISFAEAAGYPLVSMTAWDGIVRAGRLQAGERVLVQGGAGGVGSMAVQIAKARGAYVITTASARNTEFLKSIGADEVIDYTTTRFEDATKDIDLLFDAVGGETLARSPAVLKRGGRLVSVAGRPPAAACASGAIVCVPSGARGDDTALRQIGTWIEAGKLRVNIDATYPLAEAGAAQERNREGHTRGKIVLQIRPEPGARAQTP